MPTVKDVVVVKPSDEDIARYKEWPIWSSGVSEFDWEYTQCEDCYLLEGEVTVSDRPDSGESVTFGAGDFVSFPDDLSCVWKVIKPVRKHYNCY